MVGVPVLSEWWVSQSFPVLLSFVVGVPVLCPLVSQSFFEGLAADTGKPAKELIDNYFAEHEPTSLIQRFIDVAEVAQAVVFLASNGAVNGSAQRVEGEIVRSI